MPETRHFGNKVTLKFKSRQVPEQFKIQTFDMFWHHALNNIQSYALPDGRRLANPSIIVTPMPEYLLLDLYGDLVSSLEGLQWFAEKFNTNAFKMNIQRALDAGFELWAQADYSKSILVTERGISDRKNLRV